MIEPELREAVFRLKAKGRGTRRIALILEISRSAVIDILKSSSTMRPIIERASSLTPHLEVVQQLYTRCERNLSRVAEELETKLGKQVPYSTLTRFCRKHGLGEPNDTQPAGEYEFGPGVEMQHDTSPMRITVGGVERLYQAASLKFGYSRSRYLRFYRRFTRFHCKDFLTRALTFFGCACERCVIDNSSVVVACGTGAAAVMAPEMQAFEKRFRFRFLAHEKGDANRSAKVERDFDFIQKNFPKGRTFANDDDLNRQAEEWARKKNAKPHRRLREPSDVRLDRERAHARPLPDWIPPVYQLHLRRVGADGHVQLEGNEYSAPATVLGREVTLRETMDTITILDGITELCRHPRLLEGERGRSTLADHQRRPRRRNLRTHATPEECWLTAQSSVFGKYIDGLKGCQGRGFGHHVRKLYAFCQDYGVAAVEPLVQRAMEYDLYDAKRLERMLLQELGAKLFGFAVRRAADEGPGNVTPAATPPPRAPEAQLRPPFVLATPGTGGDTDGNA